MDRTSLHQASLVHESIISLLNHMIVSYTSTSSALGVVIGQFWSQGKNLLDK
jgi:hypothetical protein